MAHFIETYWGGENGNTTVDWMILTAGLVLLAAAVMATIGAAPRSLADDSTAAVILFDTGA